jgi:hypothetical protein
MLNKKIGAPKIHLSFESQILSCQIHNQTRCEPLRVAMIKMLSLETYAQGFLTTGIRFWSEADFCPNDFLTD